MRTDLAGRQLHMPSKTLSLLVAGPLALVLVAGCGSSGSDSSTGGLPVVSSEASSAPATESAEPTPSETPSEPSESPSEEPTESPSASADGTEFTDADSGTSFSVPDDFVLVTTSAEAASKLPDVFKTATDGQERIQKIQQQLAASTLMFAVRAEEGRFNDNIGLQKTSASGLTDPDQIASSSFKVKARQALTTAGATNVQIEDSKIGGRTAVHVTYRLNTTPNVYGQQYYVSAGDEKVYILTVSAGTSARAESETSTVVDSWKFSS